MVTNRTGALAMVAALALAGLAGCKDAGGHDRAAPTAPELASASQQGASTFTTNEVIPFGFETTECGNEIVVVSGSVHLVVHGTTTSSGNVQAVSHVNPQNIRGFGATTGAVYLAPGMLQTVTNLNGPAPVTETFVNNFKLIGLGSAPDFTVHHAIRLTVNANGEVTAAFEHLGTECR